jgi:hypothetical protein
MRNTRTLTADWRLLSHESAGLAIGLLLHDQGRRRTDHPSGQQADAQTWSGHAGSRRAVTDSVTISDRWRAPIIAQKQRAGGVALRSGHSGLLILSEAELARLFGFCHDLDLLQVAEQPVS